MVSFRILSGALVLCFIGSCKGVEPREASPPTRQPLLLEAEIAWTEFGIPHVTANDFRGLGFGYGYASAKAHICSIAEQILRVRGRRAEFFGPGQGGRYIDEDFGFRALNLIGRAEKILPKMSEDARRVVVGYTAGYNKFIADKGVENLPEPCKGAEWVFSADVSDVVANALRLQVAGGIGNLVRAIGAAQPGVVSSYIHGGRSTSLGSNGWALGSCLLYTSPSPRDS